MLSWLDRVCVAVASLAAHPLAERYRQARRAIHAWMFGTGTRGIEVLNVGALTVWAAALVDDRLLGLSVYIGAALVLSHWANEALASLFALAALVQLAGLLRHDPASDKLTAWGLQVGGVLWFCAALNFLATYPPINTGVGTYLMLSFVCWSAGCYLRDD